MARNAHAVCLSCVNLKIRSARCDHFPEGEDTMMTKWRKVLALLMALTLVAAACGSDSDEAATGDTAEVEEADDSSSDDDSSDDSSSDDGAVEATTIDYWLWDENQLPFYQQCAADFTDANPAININIEQFGWGDYWDGLTAAFASNTAPDVFTDHLARYPELVENGVLVPINDFVEADGFDVGNYFPGLAELWTSPDGDRFGLPKDFDTIAVVINQDMLDGAGFGGDVDNLDWNPADGGTFGELVQAMTIDANGVRGNEAGFDASTMGEEGSVYGFGLEGNFGAFGQTTFSAFAAANGWVSTDGVWADEANYGDPALAETIQWFADWIEGGFITPIGTVQDLGGTTIFQNGQAAMQTNGSWQISTLSGDATTFPVTYAPTPIGPSGDRASMFNGLADSITTSAEDPEAAWQWVSYLASPECQELVGEGAVVFPAIPSAAAIAQAAHEANGTDVSAFTTHVDNGTTFLFPITDSASRIEATIGPVMEQILRGDGTAADLLPPAAEEVNSILAS